MKKLFFFFTTLLVSKIIFAQQPTNNPATAKILLPNGWSLSPAGRSLPLGDLPLNMQVSSNGKLLAVTNNGFGKQTIQLIDISSEKLLDQRTIKKSWYGLKFSDNGRTLFVSGGNDNLILAYPVQNNKLGNADTLKLGRPWPLDKISPAGIEFDDVAQRIYTVTKEDSTLYVYDLKKRSIRQKIKLGAEAYACLLSKDKSELYISLWGGVGIAVYNTRTASITSRIATGSHPNELLRTRNGKYLLVANANDNSVSVIDLSARKTIETLTASIYPTTLSGSTTNGLALSQDDKTLFIANADNNCLAVFDISTPGSSHSKGFIPTGWYPTNVKVAGKKVFVSNGKGFSSLPLHQGPDTVILGHRDPVDYKHGAKALSDQYIGSMFTGTLSIIDMPDETALKVYTEKVYTNTPYNTTSESITQGQAGNPIPRSKADTTPIKYVFYVLKENQTYDNILGDMKEGRGDSSLCLFGEKVTPNQHALAREFVLLDNFYVDAEVSADGHNWSMAAYANDYIEKTWPISYSGRGGTYDYAGSRAIAYPKDGFIWDNCMHHKVSMRNYGEFGDDGPPFEKALREKTCAAYPGWDLKIQDIAREKVWEKDFDSLVNNRALPTFNIVYFPNDHTSGLAKGAYSPSAAVADNDAAVGRFIEHLSHSPVWGQSAVFILEDDPQGGYDHIDVHRSPAYVISPFIKKGTVNHTMYSTSGLIRTMELIAGLPPMTQYDAAALPLFDCFTDKADTTSFIARPAQVNLQERNRGKGRDAERSAAWNLIRADAVPSKELNEMVWRSIKGEDAVIPASRHSAFVLLERKKDDD